ncbi:MAG TPA: hypothetical protein VLK85_19080 [Ramlibacter sp.]|nr:hypothetical protein [Ramlibacter sp.]
MPKTVRSAPSGILVGRSEIDEVGLQIIHVEHSVFPLDGHLGPGAGAALGRIWRCARTAQTRRVPRHFRFLLCSPGAQPQHLRRPRHSIHCIATSFSAGDATMSFRPKYITLALVAARRTPCRRPSKKPQF